jgi:heme-degrading monooxygenase HmoA
MVQFLVHQKVEDYRKWKPFFDGHSDFRAKYGSKGGKVFRCKADPNEIFILFEWDSLANAERFSQSDSLKEVMKEAGVMSKSDIYFFEEEFKTAK